MAAGTLSAHMAVAASSAAGAYPLGVKLLAYVCLPGLSEWESAFQGEVQ